MGMFFGYAETTNGVTVRVQPHFSEDDSDPADNHWLWHYHIRVENAGKQTVQLVDRHWIITDARGQRQEIKGDGVVGVQPIIETGDSYDYVSACPLETPSGMMQGSFGMLLADGRRFAAAIPAFDLLSPASRSRAH